MTAVATRPVEISTEVVRRRVLRHGLSTIIVANALLAGAIFLLVRQLDGQVSAVWFGIVVLTTLADLLFCTPTRIEIEEDRIVLRTLARKQVFDRGAVLLRPARVGRGSVLVPLGRPVRSLARFDPRGRALDDLVAARVAIVRR